MKITQYRKADGHLEAAVVEAEGLRPVHGRTVVELIRLAEATGRSLAEEVEAYDKAPIVHAPPAIPVSPEEVWACGCTYAPSATFRDGELGTREGMYGYVHNPDHRPELFFKGTGRVCVGPGEAIGMRQDSKFTAPEPELGVVVNSEGAVQGYLLANDVSAWDIERENALYLPQSKIYDGCCALGPYIVTPDEVDDPYDLMMSCTITRGDVTTFHGECSTDQLRRKIEDLVRYLMMSNAAPSSSVLLTGTGIIVTEKEALAPGDVVTIEIPGFGKLSNPAAIV